MFHSQYAMGRLPRLETVDDTGRDQYCGTLTPRQLNDGHSCRGGEMLRFGIVAHVELTPLQQSSELTQGRAARYIDQGTSNALLQLHSKLNLGWIGLTL